jgi:hypothetical protein
VFAASQNTYRLIPYGFVNSLVIEPSSWERVDELRRVSDQQGFAFKALVLKRVNKIEFHTKGQKYEPF